MDEFIEELILVRCNDISWIKRHKMQTLKVSRGENISVGLSIKLILSTSGNCKLEGGKWPVRHFKSCRASWNTSITLIYGWCRRRGYIQLPLISLLKI